MTTDASTLEDAAELADAGLQVPDGGEPADELATNLPRAEHENLSTGLGADISLLSSRFMQERIGSTVYTSWHGHVRNESAEVLCQTRVQLVFRDSAGEELLTLETYLEGDQFLEGTGELGITCVGPGARAGVWTNANDIDMLNNLFTVWTVDVTFSPNVYSNTRPHPLRPVVDAAMVQPWGGAADRWQLAGTLRNASPTPIYNIGMGVFAISDDGMVHDELLDHHLDTLAPGLSWSYAAGIHVGPAFTDYMMHIKFLEDTREPTLRSATAAADTERALDAERARKRALAGAARSALSGP